MLIRVDTPATAITLGLEIVEDVIAGHGEPTVRAGMHAGPAQPGQRAGRRLLRRQRQSRGADRDVRRRGKVALSAAVRVAASTLDGVRFIA